jgi:hypothetical protein
VLVQYLAVDAAGLDEADLQPGAGLAKAREHDELVSGESRSGTIQSAFLFASCDATTPWKDDPMAAAMFFLAPLREDYERFLATMVDRDQLPQTFAEWERAIGRKLADFTAQGVIVKPVTFDAEEFVAFCLARNLPCGDQARAHFAAEAGRRPRF